MGFIGLGFGGNRHSSNTKYFHACANQRRTKNFIKKVVDEQNHLHESTENIEEAFRIYFANLFSSSEPSSFDVSACTNGI